MASTLSVGQHAEFSKTVTESDVIDSNRVRASVVEHATATVRTNRRIMRNLPYRG